MKSTKSLVVLIVMSLFTTGVSFAQEAQKEAPAAKPANCCAKAEKDGKACGHECCVAAAKEGNNCTKCGGSGKAEKKEAAHEHKK